MDVCREIILLRRRIFRARPRNLAAARLNNLEEMMKVEKHGWTIIRTTNGGVLIRYEPFKDLVFEFVLPAEVVSELYKAIRHEMTTT